MSLTCLQIQSSSRSSRLSLVLCCVVLCYVGCASELKERGHVHVVCGGGVYRV